MGPNSQLHSTPVTLEVSAAHADHGRLGAHHLADIEGFCVRQRVQHRTCQQAIDVADVMIRLAFTAMLFAPYKDLRLWKPEVDDHSYGCPFGPPRIVGAWQHQRSQSGPNGQTSRRLTPSASL